MCAIVLGHLDFVIRVGKYDNNYPGGNEKGSIMIYLRQLIRFSHPFGEAAHIYAFSGDTTKAVAFYQQLGSAW